MANTRLQDEKHIPAENLLDDLAATTPSEPAVPITTAPTSSAVEVPAEAERDPCLQQASTKPLQYVNIFVDDFISAAQKPFFRRVPRVLLCAIDDVFRPNDSADSEHRREPVSMKKLLMGTPVLGVLSSSS